MGLRFFVRRPLESWREFDVPGFECALAADGEDAWFRCETEEYAGVILDLGLPVLDGLTVLKRLRQAGIETPVLILTARGSWTERVDGIDAGADDYLAKPFQMEELIARLHAILRRSAGKASSHLTIGGVTLDARQMRASVDGSALALTPLEYRLLEILMERRGRVQSRRQLLESVWDTTAAIETRTVDMHVARLRSKMGDRGDMIETVRGIGYRFRGLDN